MNKVFIVGFMGVGKSTFGKKLANSLGCQFIDTDKYIEQKLNQSISAIFKEKGELFFRKLEEEVLREIIDLHEKAVISTGGGMGAVKANMKLMKNNGKVIYLELDEKSIFNRLNNAKANRPLIESLSEEELKELITIRLGERKGVYELANITLNALNIKSLKPEDLVEIIQKK